MLRTVEQTAGAVLNMFPDLELAVEENEPTLAIAFFNMVRGWVVELRALVHSTQDVNKASMEQIQLIVEQSTLGLMQHRTEAQTGMAEQLSQRLTDMLAVQRRNLQMNTATAAGGAEGTDVPFHPGGGISADQLLDLFVTMFGHQSSAMIGLQGQSHR